MSFDPASAFHLTPSDRIGIVKQGVEEIHRYLSTTAVLEVNGAVCQAHLERLADIIGALNPDGMPAGAGEGVPQAANGAANGARAAG